MKSFSIVLGMALTSLMLGCSSTPVELMPIGPNPYGPQSKASGGGLQVFSYLETQSDDQNQGSTEPIWHQHTDYDIYAPNGKLVKHVGNTIGHYEQTPRLVTLPVGQYFVKAHAAGYLLVRVPVMINGGQITKIHLDENWKPPAGTDKTELVTLPDCQPVGWRSAAY